MLTFVMSTMSKNIYLAINFDAFVHWSPHSNFVKLVCESLARLGRGIKRKSSSRDSSSSLINKGHATKGNWSVGSWDSTLPLESLCTLNCFARLNPKVPSRF